MKLEEGRILYNRSLGAAYRRMGIKTGPAYGAALPGQFVMAKVGEGLAPLLRRPFSIHRLIDNGHGVEGAELLYKIVGPTTRRMGGLNPGDAISLLGPLGKNFVLPAGTQPVALVGGGIGIAPLVFLASHMLENGIAPERVQVFLGGRSARDILCADDFRTMGLTVYATSDDGSTGEKGVVTRPLERALKAGAVEQVYACGPVGMLSGVIALADKYRVAGQVSVETIMACGIGACMGCAVKSRDARDEKCRHACLDGPVFNTGQITLEH